jgi:hypothetical protein
VSESLSNVGGMANTNQQTGQGNAALGFLLGRQFNKKKNRDGGSSREDYENRVELERHKSQLRMDEKAHAANIRDEELRRSYDIDGSGEGHIQPRVRAFRKSTEYEGGEVPYEDKLLGMRTGGYRKPVEAEEDPSKGQQMRAVPVTEGSEIPFTKKSVHANDKRAEQARIDSSYGIGERSMTDTAYEAEAPARAAAAADIVMPKRGRESAE